MGRLDEAVKLIFRNPVPLNPSFYLHLLALCIDSRAEKHGRLIHKHLLLNGFESSVSLNTKMIIFYAKIGDMGHARKVFDKMPERSIVSWTALLSGYSQIGRFKDALMIFQNLHHSGVKGNQFTYGSALRACTKLACLWSGKQIQGCLYKSTLVGNLFVQSALVDLHSKCGDIEDASYVFQMMSEKDLVCWNTMIRGYTVQGFSNDAFRIFYSMVREGIPPDCFTFGSLLGACDQGARLCSVKQLHGILLQHDFNSNDQLSRLLIDAYAKCGSIKLAFAVFQKMAVKDIMSYTAMIVAFARERDQYTGALNLFGEIYKSGMSLDGFLLCTMLNICANSSWLDFGRQIHTLVLKYVPIYDVAISNALIDMYAKCGELEEANNLFNQMEEKNVISWSSIIDGYAKHGYGHKAMTLFRMMENEGLKPNDVTFLSLLFACSHSGLAKEAWECFRKMTEKYSIAPTVKHYSCMVDLLARGGWLEEAFNLIQKMKVQPNASLSGAILGASNVYGDISIAKRATELLSDLGIGNSSNDVALANVYAAAGLWDHSLTIHNSMEENNLRKCPGRSIFLFSRKETQMLQNL